MRIQISFPWDLPGTRIVSNVRGHEVVRSHDLGLDPDYVIDVGHVAQPASMQVAPERRAWCATEPSGVMCWRRWMPDILETYPRLVMGWHPEMLALPQGVLHCRMAPWIKSWDPNTPKVFGISGFISSKNAESCPGYGLRRYLLDNEFGVNVPSMVWNFRKKWKGEEHVYPAPDKHVGMDRMFHLAIENCSEPHYHSEKVLDCFMSFSVPLYWGDPRIGDYFDPGGLIPVDRKNLLDTVNSLTPEKYDSMSSSIGKNRMLAEKYLDEVSPKVEILLDVLGKK